MENKYSKEDYELLKNFLKKRSYIIGTAGKGPEGVSEHTEYRYFSDDGVSVWDSWYKLMNGYLKRDRTKEDYLVHAFINRPLEEMPIFINDRHWSEYARWRLSLGK